MSGLISTNQQGKRPARAPITDDDPPERPRADASPSTTVEEAAQAAPKPKRKRDRREDVSQPRRRTSVAADVDSDVERDEEPLPSNSPRTVPPHPTTSSSSSAGEHFNRLTENFVSAITNRLNHANSAEHLTPRASPLSKMPSTDAVSTSSAATYAAKQVPKLQGADNYKEWAFRTLNYFRTTNVWDVTNGRDKRPVEFNARGQQTAEFISWSEKNSHALNFIVTTLELQTDPYTTYQANSSSAADCWQAFEDQFGAVSYLEWLSVWTAWNNLDGTEYTTVSKIAEQLRVMNGDLARLIPSTKRTNADMNAKLIVCCGNMGLRSLTENIVATKAEKLFTDGPEAIKFETLVKEYHTYEVYHEQQSAPVRPSAMLTRTASAPAVPQASSDDLVATITDLKAFLTRQPAKNSPLKGSSSSHVWCDFCKSSHFGGEPECFEKYPEKKQAYLKRKSERLAKRATNFSANLSAGKRKRDDSDIGQGTPGRSAPGFPSPRNARPLGNAYLTHPLTDTSLTTTPQTNNAWDSDSGSELSWPSPTPLVGMMAPVKQ